MTELSMTEHDLALDVIPAPHSTHGTGGRFDPFLSTHFRSPAPKFFLTSLFHVSTLSTVAHPLPCTRVVFVELVIVVSPRIEEGGGRLDRMNLREYAICH